MRGPFSKEILLQSKMLQQQTECIAIIYKHLGVLMTPAHWAKSAQWWIQGRAIIGQWGPFSKGLLLQSWKATATNLMYSSDLTAFRKKCCYFYTPATKLWGVYWNHHVRPSVRPSVCPAVRPSVCPAAFGFQAHNCFPFTPIIMKLHMQTPHESRICPIDFEVKGQGHNA